MLGPFHEEKEVSSALGTSQWSLSPRFLLRQGEEGKVRVIDDLKASGVNQAFGSSSYLALQDTVYCRAVEILCREPCKVMEQSRSHC